MRGRLAALAALTGLLLGGLVQPRLVLADSATFGSPSAVSNYLHGITFAQPVTLDTRPSRVELLLEEPGVPGVSATEVGVPEQTGQIQLQTGLDTTHGQLVTNTTVSARWRLTFSDGTIETGPSKSVTYADSRFSWRTMSGAVVRLHWYQGDDSFARRAIALGDRGIEQAANLLGVQVTEPVDFFVYADQQAFSQALGPGAHENVAGEAHPDIRTMFGLITPDEIDTSEVSRVVTHELTHLVFDTATKNPYHEPLHWLNEGLAVYLSEGYTSEFRSSVGDAVSNRSIMPLAALVGNFPATYDRFFLAYGESVSAVDFIIRTFGKDALVRLIRSYADGVTDDQAFTNALGLDTAAFDGAWLAAVGASTPRRFGPKPAAPGPTPSDWTVAGAASQAGTGGASGAPSGSAAAAGDQASAPPLPDGHGTGDSGDLVGLLAPVGAVLVAAGLLGAILIARIRRRRPGGEGPQ